MLLQIPLHSLARAHVFERKGGDILYSGLCWLDESVRVGSRLRRVVGYASRVTGLKKYFKFKQSMTLVWTHVHALPCSITLLADLLPEATWSSFCSSPFIHTWLGRPYVAGPGMHNRSPLLLLLFRSVLLTGCCFSWLTMVLVDGFLLLSMLLLLLLLW